MSLFKKAVAAKRNVKMLVYGPSGSGKTWLGLASKKVLKKQKVCYIGNEQGAVHYADVPELSGFDVLETRDISKVEAAVRELENGDHHYGVLVVDTLTDLYKCRQRMYEKPDKNGESAISMRSWGLIKRQHDELVRRMINLPMHIVLISQEKPIYDKKGQDLIQVGVTPDSDKKDPSMVDVIIRLVNDNDRRVAFVEKDRTRKAKTLEWLEDPTFALWASGNAAKEEGAKIEQELDFNSLIQTLWSAKSKREQDAVKIANKDYIESLTQDQTELIGAIPTPEDATHHLRDACSKFKSEFGQGYFEAMAATFARYLAIENIEAVDESDSASWFPVWQAWVAAMSVGQRVAVTKSLHQAINNMSLGMTTAGAF